MSVKPNGLTPTLANVSAAATSTAVFASNPQAVGRIVVNDSGAVCYLKYGTTASATSYTARLDANAQYEFPQFAGRIYTGAVECIWASATGAARTTEVT